MLENYYDYYYAVPPKNDFILTEYPLSKVVINNVPLKGFADKIQFWKNDIVITITEELRSLSAMTKFPNQISLRTAIFAFFFLLISASELRTF